MLLPRFVVWMFLLGVLVLGASVVSGQDNYPSKTVRIVTAEAGGNNDWVARLTAQELARSLGQPVIVENRGGLSAELVAKAPPDGHTLLFYGSAVWIAPFLHPVAYDPVKDLSPITLVITSPNVLAVHPSMPVKSVADLIALAKARPGVLNYGAGTIGASPYLAMELFKTMADVDIVRIAYKGTPSSVIGLIGGQVHTMVAGLGSVDVHLKSGKLRPLAVADLQPSALLPGLPTVAATLPGFEVVTQIAMFAPAKTPETLINRLNREVVRILNRTDIKERIFNGGGEVAGHSPEQLAAIIKSDMAKWGKVIKEARLRGE